MTIRLEHDEFRASVADVRGATETLGAARDRAASQVDLLLDTWRGRAGRSFAAAWSDWLGAAGRLERSLAEVADVLAEVHASHTLVDDRAGDDLARMRGRLG